MKRIKTFEDYPIVDGHRLHFCLIPIEGKDGKFRAANLLKNGYENPEKDPAKTPFKTHWHCQKVCNVHNAYHGFESKKLVDLSMKNALSPESKKS